MKKLILSLLFLIITIGLNGCGDDKPKKSPIKIQTKIHTTYWDSMAFKVPQITITAVDDVTIKDVIVNNGNGCPVSRSRPTLPATLKYGDRVIRIYTAKCNVMKVEVVTNKGNWSVEY